MGALLGAVKGLKIWQLVVLAAVLVGAPGVTYGTYAVLTDGSSDRLALAEGQQLIPVQYGDLVNAVSTNGSIVFPNRVTLTFGSQGTVGEVLVGEGQQVEEGQMLATLSAATVASLERAAASARRELQQAEEALDALNQGPTAQAIAKAEADLAQARLSEETAKKEWETLLRSATTADTKEVQEAQRQEVNARLKLENARRDLATLQADWDQKLANARTTLEEAEEEYRLVYQRYLGIALFDAELTQGPEELLKAWGADLEILFDQYSLPEIRKGYLAEDPVDDETTPWDENVVWVWHNFLTIAPGDVREEMNAVWEVLEAARDTVLSQENQAAKALLSAEEGVGQAQETLAQREEALADLLDPDPLMRSSVETQYALAQANRSQAEEELAALLGGPDPLEAALMEAEVASARIALDEAIQRLEDATIRASMAGVVSSVNVEAGQTVNASTPIAEVVDPTVVEVDGVVDEIDVLFIQEGAQATVTMDALAGQQLPGTVSSISSAATSSQGVVSYGIRIRVETPEGVSLREGLSAVANIVIYQENDVLLVPLQALYGTFQAPVVRVSSNGRVEERPVVLGNSDDFWVAVQEGLAEGETIVMESQQANTTGFGFGGPGGGFPGGFGGSGAAFRQAFGGGGGFAGRQGPEIRVEQRP